VNFILVYQPGIANLFRLPPLDTHTDGANECMYEGDFRTAEAMTSPAILACAEVRVASCNRAGDIAELVWAQGLSDAPFRDQASAPPPLVH